MSYLHDGAWILVKILSYGGLTVALLGIAIFGWYFVRINAHAGRSDTNEIPRESWRGKGATLGLKVLLTGAGMQVMSFLLSGVLDIRF